MIMEQNSSAFACGVRQLGTCGRLGLRKLACSMHTRWLPRGAVNGPLGWPDVADVLCCDTSWYQVGRVRGAKRERRGLLWWLLCYCKEGHMHLYAEWSKATTSYFYSKKLTASSSATSMSNAGCLRQGILRLWRSWRSRWKGYGPYYTVDAVGNLSKHTTFHHTMKTIAFLSGVRV